MLPCSARKLQAKSRHPPLWNYQWETRIGGIRILCMYVQGSPICSPGPGSLIGPASAKRAARITAGNKRQDQRFNISWPLSFLRLFSCFSASLVPVSGGVCPCPCRGRGEEGKEAVGRLQWGRCWSIECAYYLVPGRAFCRLFGPQRPSLRPAGCARSSFPSLLFALSTCWLSLNSVDDNRTPVAAVSKEASSTLCLSGQELNLSSRSEHLEAAEHRVQERESDWSGIW